MRKLKVLYISICLVFASIIFIPSVAANEMPIVPDMWPLDNDWNGYLNREYNFRVYAWDPDEDEELEFRVWWDDNGWSEWYSMTNEYNENGMTKSWQNIGYTWTIQNYVIFVESRDDDGASSIAFSHLASFYDHYPTLSSGYVSPTSGDSSTQFTFRVKYTDGDNQAPGMRRLNYRRVGDPWGAGQFNLNEESSSYTTGAWHSRVAGNGQASVNFVDDNYEFYFEFHDGDTGHTVYYPSGGASNPLSFTVSTNHNPDAFYSTNITYIPSTYFFRNEEVTFYASTTDPDGDQIRYGFDWDNDGTIDTWTGYYPSGTTASQTHTYTTEENPAGCIPNIIAVTADDGNGGTYGPVPKSINLFNQDPSNDVIGGPAVVGLAIEYTWYIVVDDPEDDDMQITWNWGDGTAEDVSGWVADGTNSTQTHTYTVNPQGGDYTIQVDINDEYYVCAGSGGTVHLTKDVNVLTEPTSPSGVTATPYNTAIHLSWSIPQFDGGDPVDTYGIRYWNVSVGEGVSDTSIFEISWENASNYDGAGYNITGLDNDWEYGFKMSANNTYDMSEWSSNVTATPGHTPPSTPVMQTLPQYSSQALDIEWSPSTFYDGASIDHYNISYSTDNIAYTNLDDTTITTYHVSGLTNGLTYYFKVNCTDDQDGVSQTSGYSWTTIDDINPTTPILADLPDLTYDTTIIVSWSASTDDESGIDYYVVQEDDTNLFDSLTNNYEGSDLTTTFASNHVRGKTYYYRARSYDKAGNPSEWNGPVQTSIKSNTSLGTEYSKITEIWFDKNNLIINQPVTVTVTVEDKYIIPTGFVSFLEEGSLTETVMRISGVGEGYYKFNAVWTPTISGQASFKIKVINQHDAANQVTVPLTVLSTNISQPIPTVLVFEDSDEDVITATFSTMALNVSAYQDMINIYHVSFGTNPDTMIDIDLTELELSLDVGYFFFIRLSWLDKYKMECMVHGATKPKNYIIRRSGATVIGYNDWWTKVSSIFTDPKFVLLSETTAEMKLSSLENSILAEYDSP